MTLESIVEQVVADCGPAQGSWHLGLDPHPAEVRLGRMFAREHLSACLDQQLETVLLLLSEVITNAVLHGRSRIRLDVSLHAPHPSTDEGPRPLETAPPAVLVAVTDASARVPRQRQRSESLESGRGIQILEAFSDSWGWTQLEQSDGKVVWFVVKPRDAAAPAERQDEAPLEEKEAGRE